MRTFETRQPPRSFPLTDAAIVSWDAACRSSRTEPAWPEPAVARPGCHEDGLPPAAAAWPLCVAALRGRSEVGAACSWAASAWPLCAAACSEKPPSSGLARFTSAASSSRTPPPAWPLLSAFSSGQAPLSIGYTWLTVDQPASSRRDASTPRGRFPQRFPEHLQSAPRPPCRSPALPALPQARNTRTRLPPLNP